MFCNAPDDFCAQNIARRLVNDKITACVNILPACRSIYQWEGKLKEENEIPLLIKTTAERISDVETTIRQLHPYEMPEIIVLPIVGGGDDYLRWVSEQCG